MESIRSAVGFYGWKCQSYFHYLLGLCPHKGDIMLLAGEDCSVNSSGMFLVKTKSDFPYAMGPVAEEATRERKLGDDKLILNEEELKLVRKELLEGGNFFDHDETNTFYLKLLQKLQQKRPKVLSINEK